MLGIHVINELTNTRSFSKQLGSVIEIGCIHRDIYIFQLSKHIDIGEDKRPSINGKRRYSCILLYPFIQSLSRFPFVILLDSDPGMRYFIEFLHDTKSFTEMNTDLCTYEIIRI